MTPMSTYADDDRIELVAAIPRRVPAGADPALVAADVLDTLHAHDATRRYAAIQGEQAVAWAAGAFWLAVCLPCTERDDVAKAVPFTSSGERARWCVRHRAATGHDRWRLYSRMRGVVETVA